MHRNRIAQINLTQWTRNVYEPSDDSFLLVDALLEHSKRWLEDPPTVCMEIGTGSGYVLCSLILILKSLGIRSPAFLATDINPMASVSTADTLSSHGLRDKVDIVLADLACSMYSTGSIDLLLFNPPYVPTPEEEVDDMGSIAAAWAGGYRGRKVLNRLLPQLPQLMSPEGEVFIVAVQENEPEDIIRDMQTLGFRGRVAMTRTADEERLHILYFQKGLV